MAVMTFFGFFEFLTNKTSSYEHETNKRFNFSVFLQLSSTKLHLHTNSILQVVSLTIPKFPQFQDISHSLPVEDINIALVFTTKEIQLLSEGSAEYTFKHAFEMNRINCLQIGGDFEFIEQVALRYGKGN
jgi:hypothetical protein